MPAKKRRRRQGHPERNQPGGEIQKLRDSQHRRRSSCGRAFAMCSTTSPTTWLTWPTTPATSTWPSAGALAGRLARLKPGKPPAGSKWPAGCKKTSPRAQPEPGRAAGLGAGSRPRRRALCPRLVQRRPRHTGRPLHPGRLPAPAGPAACWAKTRRNWAKPCSKPKAACAPFTSGDGVLVVSFTSKAHAIGPAVIEGAEQGHRPGRSAI